MPSGVQRAKGKETAPERTPCAGSRRGALRAPLFCWAGAAAALSAVLVLFYVLSAARQEDEGEELVRRFVTLKNAGDPQANDLLNPTPAVPSYPVTPAEADRLDAEFMLRGDYRVVEVRQEPTSRSFPGSAGASPSRAGASPSRAGASPSPAGASPSPAGASPSRFVLVAEGSLSSEHFRVQTSSGVESRQRVMYNPDILIEVRDGKIHGVGVRLHRD